MKSKDELLEIYNLQGSVIGTQNRKLFYEESRQEYQKTGVVSRQVKSIRLILMNSNGRIYLQKRSPQKSENPGLFDKTVGGHVKAGHSLNLTVVQECHEELGLPAVVLSDEEYDMASTSTDLHVIGIFRKVETINKFLSLRKSKEGDFEQPYISSFYIGYYDGAIRFCDGESTGIEVVTLEELNTKLTEAPENFTQDLKFMIQRYGKYLVPIDK